MTRVNKAEASEWLGSLQQIGQGWYVNVALAIKAGAPQALGMTAREFAREIGQQLINPDDAIIELYQQKHSMKRIAETLGIDDHRVEYVLAKARKIPVTTRRQEMLDAGSFTAWSTARLEAAHRGTDRDITPEISGSDRDSSKEPAAPPDAKVDKLQEQIEKLTAERDEAIEQSDENYDIFTDQIKDLKERIKDLGKDKADALRQAREEVWNMMTDQERDRAKKEADAWAQAEADSILSGLSGGYVRNVISALSEAAESLKEFIAQGHGVSKESLAEIEAAHAGFVEELNRARMAELSE